MAAAPTLVLRDLMRDVLQCLDGFLEDREIPEGEVWDLAMRLRFVYRTHLRRLDPRAGSPPDPHSDYHPAFGYLMEVLERQPARARRRKA